MPWVQFLVKRQGTAFASYLFSHLLSVYLKTVLIYQTTWLNAGMIWNEYEKEVFVANFRALFQNLPKVVEENHENLRIACLRTEIWSRNLLKKNQRC